MQIDDLIYPYIILSLVLFVTIHLWKTKVYYKFLFLFLLILFLDIFYIISDYFTGQGIDESVFFHLFHALDFNTLIQFKVEVLNLLYVFLFLFIWSIFYLKFFIYSKKNISYLVVMDLINLSV